MHSMTAESPIHGSAMLMMNSGKLQSGSPSLGSWVNYGLGSVNENMPGYVVMLDHTGGPISGAKNWSSGYMPATYAGTVFRPEGSPINDLKLPDGTTRPLQRDLLDTLAKLNERHRQTRLDQADLASRIATYELAYKMQAARPRGGRARAGERADQEALRPRPASRRRPFGTRCLLGPAVSGARRPLHPGLLGRFAQRRQLGRPRRPGGQPHEARRRDRPADRRAARRISSSAGCLDETLVVWGGEFGRQPTAEYAVGTGRDHNSMGFTMWMAGGGVKGGVSVGATDEIGSRRRRGADARPAAPRHRAPSAGARSQRPQLLLPRARPEARRRRADRAGSGNSGLDRVRASRAISAPGSAGG